MRELKNSFEMHFRTAIGFSEWIGYSWQTSNVSINPLNDGSGYEIAINREGKSLGTRLNFYYFINY
jgi:hypothetical protein